MVKALDSLPELLDVDSFYMDMYLTCGNDIGQIINYCYLFDLSKDEVLDAVEILRKIAQAR